jgi:hypothetical protein
MLAGLIALVNQDLRDGWYHQPARYIAVGNQITRDRSTDDCDGAVEITDRLLSYGHDDSWQTHHTLTKTTDLDP